MRKHCSGKKKKTFSTRDSQVIPHLTTNLARRNLASQFGMGWGACSLGMAECDSALPAHPIYTRIQCPSFTAQIYVCSLLLRFHHFLHYFHPKITPRSPLDHPRSPPDHPQITPRSPPESLPHRPAFSFIVQRLFPNYLIIVLILTHLVFNRIETSGCMEYMHAKAL